MSFDSGPGTSSGGCKLSFVFYSCRLGPGVSSLSRKKRPTLGGLSGAVLGAGAPNPFDSSCLTLLFSPVLVLKTNSPFSRWGRFQQFSSKKQQSVSRQPCFWTDWWIIFFTLSILTPSRWFRLWPWLTTSKFVSSIRQFFVLRDSLIWWWQKIWHLSLNLEICFFHNPLF